MTKIEFLVPLMGNSTDQALIERTCLLARHYHGHVTTILSQISAAEMLAWPSDAAFASASPTIYDSVIKANDESWAIQQAFIQGLAKDNPELSLEREIGNQDMQIAKRGALSDVIVFSCETARGKTGASNLFTSTLMEARAPVLVLRGADAQKFDKIAIAWDGGLEASRAAKASLPLLARAHEIIILQSRLNLDEAVPALSDPHRLQSWLAGRGVVATIEVLTQGTDVAVDVLKFCQDQRIDLLVSGAYGHSRAREFVFGGVTRTLVKAIDSPSLFLCH